MRFFKKLTFGLPMEKGKFLLHDTVSHVDIHLYRDRLNRLWMAGGRWDLIGRVCYREIWNEVAQDMKNL